MRGLNRSPQFLMFVSDLERCDERAGGAVIQRGYRAVPRDGQRRQVAFCHSVLSPALPALVCLPSALPAPQVSALLNKARNAVALQIALSLECVECLLTRDEARRI
jgi:hypothetical protein